jgi:hypothetical protein
MKGSDGRKLMGSTSKGCPICIKGKGVKICQKFWLPFNVYASFLVIFVKYFFGSS